MADLAQQFVREVTAPGGAWLLLLLFVPLLFVLVSRYWVAALLGSKTNNREQQQSLRLPPSPPALPVLGHMHLVGSLPHVSLDALAKKHGYEDLMLLRLGAMPVLVVSSPLAAEAVLRTHDLVFASRPYALATEIILYGPSDIGFTPYGEYWRQAKKLVTTHLLSANKVRSLRRAREDEVSRVMAQIGEAAAAGAAVNVSELLGSFTNDVACRAVMGQSFRTASGLDTRQLRRLVSETSQLISGFNVEEFFPFLARFGVLSKAVRAKSERARRRWDELLDRVIQDHEEEERDHSSPAAASDRDDFIHVLLSLRQEYGLTREQMKAILLDVFFAGIETSSSTLDFAMAELMRRPSAMRKLQAELRGRVPESQELVTEADLADAPYLRAVVKETLRLHPVAPLLAPHLATSSCRVVDGFAVPAGVRVVINAWAIGRDARFWDGMEDPEEFVPERFLEEGGGSAAGVDFRGGDFRFLPFGAGRRMCPGMNFAVANVEVMLTNLVRRFDWKLPPGEEGVDMAEVFGLVVLRKQKLVLVPKLRV